MSPSAELTIKRTLDRLGFPDLAVVVSDHSFRTIKHLVAGNPFLGTIHLCLFETLPLRKANTAVVALARPRCVSER